MIANRSVNAPFIIATMLLLSIAATSVIAEEETRWSTSTQNTKAAQERGLPGKVTVSEFAALVEQGERGLGKRSQQSTKAGDPRAAAADSNYWFYAVDVVLFNDHDRDGHFHGIDLWFDADTYYAEADVYAVVYLSLNDGPWNEYFATDNFTLFGTAADDAFNIVTELSAGYPTGSYDLLIELFDAYDDRFLASYGPADTPALAFLPLEDANRDILRDTTVIVRNGGGSLGWLMLLALFCVPRIAARRSPAP